MADQDLNKKAIDLFEEGVFPVEWRLVPIVGKAPKLQNWPEADFQGDKLKEMYWSSQHSGLGVLTGKPSGGLVAIDIDGPEADERFKAVLGEAYEAPGEETTMSWTSGKAGRRQILYRVPAGLVDQLDRLTKLGLDGESGEWKQVKGEEHSQEVALRFNRCQSVLPGSVHPGTRKRYHFLNYNKGEVATAPSWLIDALLPHTGPQRWMEQAEDKISESKGSLPDNEMRGWLFKENSEAMKLLQPRLQDLVFNHEVFDRYGWEPKDSSPQMVSGCPWHGGESGTAFQYHVHNGNWFCHGCQVGGDVIDFMHKIRTGDKHASRPTGQDLERYVGTIAEGLGYDWPDCAARVSKVQQVAEKEAMTSVEFFAACRDILERYEVREEAHFELMGLVYSCGRQWQYRNGSQVEASYNRYKRQREDAVDLDGSWAAKAKAQKEYLIPGLLSMPNSVMLHARGGLGKTKAAISLAKVIGKGLAMRVRGTEVLPNRQGNVLFIGSDMSETEYADYFEQQGIDPATDTWLKFKPKWQQDEMTKMFRWIKEYKPALVIIDSLTSVSTEIEAKENEREYANGVYELARENGRSFPATCFIWIHHNTKNGEQFRGTDALRNAVSETWELKHLDEEERAIYGPQAVALVVDKSRSGRAGDRFLMNTDVDENVEVRDLTPEEATFKGSQVVQPKTLILSLLRAAEGGLTVSEIHDGIAARQVGAGEKVPARRTVDRWVKNWESQGLILDSGELRYETGAGRPSTVWRHTGNPEREKNSLFNGQNPQTPSPESDLISDRFTTFPASGAPEDAMSLMPGETVETAVSATGINDISTNFSPEHGAMSQIVVNPNPVVASGSRETPNSDEECLVLGGSESSDDPFGSIPTLAIEDLSEILETETGED